MIIDGKKTANHIQRNLAEEIGKIKQRPPALAFVLVGEDPPSQLYVELKKKSCQKVGITSLVSQLKSNTSQEELLKTIAMYNKDPSVDGIIVQQPLPKQIDTKTIMSSIAPEKDVDGFNPTNLGKLLIQDDSGFVPCTPLGIQTLLHTNFIDLSSKHVVIVGRSYIVGRPLALLLSQKHLHANATVTLAHSRSTELAKLTKSADILIAAVGKPHLITKDMVKKESIVIDVGINRVGKKIVGDVDFENVKKVASAITPVPGGVGPMTITCLMSNTFLSYQRKFLL